MSERGRLSRRSLLGLGIAQVRERFDEQIPAALARTRRVPPPPAWDHPPPPGSERFTRPAAERLAEACAVAEDDRVLDWGCGQGEVALAAARRGAHVTAVDRSAAALARGEALAAAEGLSIEWIQGDGLGLVLGDGWFDRVLSGFGVIWAAAPPTAVREMLRVARPGGTIGFTAWRNSGFAGALFRSARELGLLDQSPTAYGREERLRQDIEPFVETLEIVPCTLDLELPGEALADLVAQAAAPAVPGLDLLLPELEAHVDGDRTRARYIQAVGDVPAV